MPSQKEVNKFLTKFRGGTIQKEIDALIKKFGLSNAKAKDMAISYNASGGPDPRLSPWGPADIPEEAPANATGTAVAGTGDDSSTVVVKRKKKMQDKLMRRLGIKETLDRLVPDLEYTEDEITARKNKLKEMAVNAGKKLPQDPDVRKVKGTQPKKYYKTLSKADKDKRAAHFAKQDYKKSDDQDDYKPAPGDKEAKTKTSKFTKKFKQMYGEEILDEKIKGLENKAKKTGMPYSILKKVYDRGMAAWKGGHRPGATQQQWAFARVNSFVTKSPGTWGKADKDLAKQVRGK